MARRDRAEIARKQKEAKQKKLLILLCPLFLGLAAWQGPAMFKAFSGSSAPPPPPVVATTPAPTDPTAAPTTQQGGTETTAAAPNGLPDTDPQPASGIDRLISFSRFTGRDPFKVTAGSTAPSSSGTGGTSGQEASAALFEVNGSSQTVAVGDSFPSSDPTFRLVELAGDTATVGLVSGSFEGGQDTVEFSVGAELQLVGDDGTSFTVKLVSISSGA